jgi:hypothetical protein
LFWSGTLLALIAAVLILTTRATKRRGDLDVESAALY